MGASRRKREDFIRYIRVPDLRFAQARFARANRRSCRFVNLCEAPSSPDTHSKKNGPPLMNEGGPFFLE